MLLRHPWLVPLLKPPIISEENELSADEFVDTTEPVDKEVAAWVRQAIENRQNDKLGKKLTPALHTAPLNVLPAS